MKQTLWLIFGCPKEGCCENLCCTLWAITRGNCSLVIGVWLNYPNVCPSPPKLLNKTFINWWHNAFFKWYSYKVFLILFCILNKQTKHKQTVERNWVSFLSSNLGKKHFFEFAYMKNERLMAIVIPGILVPTGWWEFPCVGNNTIKGRRNKLFQQTIILTLYKRNTKPPLFVH